MDTVVWRNLSPSLHHPSGTKSVSVWDSADSWLHIDEVELFLQVENKTRSIRVIASLLLTCVQLDLHILKLISEKRGSCPYQSEQSTCSCQKFSVRAYAMSQLTRIISRPTLKEETAQKWKAEHLETKMIHTEQDWKGCEWRRKTRCQEAYHWFVWLKTLERSPWHFSERDIIEGAYHRNSFLAICKVKETAC